MSFLVTLLFAQTVSAADLRVAFQGRCHVDRGADGRYTLYVNDEARGSSAKHTDLIAQMNEPENKACALDRRVGEVVPRADGKHETVLSNDGDCQIRLVGRGQFALFVNADLHTRADSFRRLLEVEKTMAACQGAAVDDVEVTPAVFGSAPSIGR